MVGFYFTTIFFSRPTVNVTFKINHQYHQTLAFGLRKHVDLNNITQ